MRRKPKQDSLRESGRRMRHKAKYGFALGASNLAFRPPASIFRTEVSNAHEQVCFRRVPLCHSCSRACCRLCVPLQVRAQAVSLDPAKMPRIGTVDERFVSYNIEMAEVTGGNFWKPYPSKSAATAGATEPPQSASTPAGMDPNMYQYRPPIDLSNPRLRKLASALGPAYVRVSGTWANSVYFADSDNPPARRQRVLAVC